MGAKSKGRMPRNKKKAWKKQIDISEVEEYLDDVRLQERFGGLVADKQNQDIFVVDSKPQKKQHDSLQSQNRPWRAKVDQDNLRCFQSLKGLPGAKVPVKTNMIKDKRPAFVKAKTVTKKAKRATRAVQISEVQNKKQVARKNLALRDPWESNDSGDEDDWAAVGMAHRQRVRMDTRVRRPLYMTVKTSLLPAVEVPHAGQSYHPEAQDHTDLIQSALRIEDRKEADFQRWERQTTAKFPRERPTQEDWIEEMSGGLNNEGDPQEGEEISGGAPPRKIPKPKTKQQRRKMRERKVAEREKLGKVSTRRRENEVFRLRTLQREMRAQAARTAARQARRVEQQCARAEQPLTLGRHRYEAAPLELNLTDELPGVLRNVKVEGDPLEERYKSLQRRNVIEPRVRTTQKKKYKRKRFDRITASDREPNKLKTERNF